MTKAMTPSTKPITREQIGKFYDKLVPHLEQSGIKCDRFQAVLKNRALSTRMNDEIVELVRSYADRIGDAVRVNRAVAPVYPVWAHAVHPEFENTGLIEYDLSEVEQYVFGQQKAGYVDGHQIYAFLKKNGMIKSCHDLRDLQAIKKLGAETFVKYFKGKVVFAWKSVVRRSNDTLLVPYLTQATRDTLHIHWYELSEKLGALDPALLHR